MSFADTALPKRDTPKNIHVLLNTADTYFSLYFLSGISRVLNERICSLILHDMLDSMKTIAQTIEQALERGADRIIVQPCTGPEEISDVCRRAVERCGEMDLGEFGRIYFIDWDQTRGRTRTVQVMIIGE